MTRARPEARLLQWPGVMCTRGACWPPQLPVAVGEAECPETLLLDRGRLVAAQNELQRLSLTAAALLIAAQLLAMKRLPPGTSSPENRRRAWDALVAVGSVSLQWARHVHQRRDVRRPTSASGLAGRMISGCMSKAWVSGARR
jgi:T-complex protein 11